MPDKKQRVEILEDVAAETLFRSDRTCCICRQRRKPVQLHHIDDDPGNNVIENLAVLCFDCHRETQIRGGFDRKLDASQVKLYKADWLKRVETKREESQDKATPDSTRPASVPGQILRYLQIKEKSEEHSYDFEADYVLVGSTDSTADSETNLCISAFVTRRLQRFRADAIACTSEKNKMKNTQFAATAWDSLAISHSVSLFTSELLSLDFQLAGYHSGAVHPHTQTITLNFRLYPSMQLELCDIFKASSDYLNVLSRNCVADIQRQRLPYLQNVSGAENVIKHPDQWVLAGAGPEYRNFECFSFRKNGMVIHFDPYKVGSYAEGKYETFIPSSEITGTMQEEIIALLKWD